ncbi:MAG TPA: PEP-CTERM sorting domain-containing protein [Rariglobus sp.]
MKSKLIALLALAAPVAATAAAGDFHLVAGWDFGQFTAAGYAVTDPAQADFATSIGANFSSTNGFNSVTTHDGSTPVSSGTGTISWAYNDASAELVVSRAGSQSINTTMAVFAGTEMSNGNSDPISLALGFNNFDSGSFSITVDMTGFEDYTASEHGSFANFSFAASGSATIQWTLDGISVGSSTFATGDTTTFVKQELDLGAEFFGGSSTLVGTIVGGDSFAIDNVQFYGVASAVPEPSTYAALAGVAGLVMAVYRRRRAA